MTDSGRIHFSEFDDHTEDTTAKTPRAESNAEVAAGWISLWLGSETSTTRPALFAGGCL